MVFLISLKSKQKFKLITSLQRVERSANHSLKSTNSLTLIKYSTMKHINS